MTRIGVVGLGEFGIRYVHALRAQSGVEVAWGVDLNDQRRAQAASAGATATTARLDEALGDPALDAIVVTTPEAAHRDIAIAALEAGKHAIVEKPMATEDADALAMIEAAERAGKMLIPAMLLRFDSRYAQLKQRLSSIAPVRNIYAYRNFDRRLFSLYSRSHSLIENAIHDIDLICWYVGSRVIDVHGFTRNTLGRENPDVNWGVLEFENGAIAVLQTTWLYPPQEHADLQWNAGIQVMGARGVLEVRNDGDGFTANTEDQGILLLDQSGWADIHGEPRGAFGAMLRHLIAVVRGEVAYAGATPPEALEAVRIARRLIDDASGRAFS